jgi:hypothetical protein
MAHEATNLGKLATRGNWTPIREDLPEPRSLSR